MWPHPQEGGGGDDTQSKPWLWFWFWIRALAARASALSFVIIHCICIAFTDTFSAPLPSVPSHALLSSHVPVLFSSHARDTPRAPAGVSGFCTRRNSSTCESRAAKSYAQALQIHAGCSRSKESGFPNRTSTDMSCIESIILLRDLCHFSCFISSTRPIAAIQQARKFEAPYRPRCFGTKPKHTDGMRRTTGPGLVHKDSRYQIVDASKHGDESRTKQSDGAVQLSSLRASMTKPASPGPGKPPSGSTETIKFPSQTEASTASDDMSLGMEQRGRSAKQSFSKHAGSTVSATWNSATPPASNRNSRTSNGHDATPRQDGKSFRDKRTSSTMPSILRGHHSFMSHAYEPFPKPFNVTTFLQTTIFANEPCHPKHIQIRRRLKSFDPKAFIWAVRCPLGVSKKPTYRHMIEKKVRRAFARELRSRGYNEDGSMMETSKLVDNPAPRSDAEIRGRISGALLITLSKDEQKTLKAKGEEIRANVRSVLDGVLKHRETVMRNQTRMRPTLQGSAGENHTQRVQIQSS